MQVKDKDTKTLMRDMEVCVWTECVQGVVGMTGR